MKITITSRNLLFGLCFLISSAFAMAENGLERVFVEKYYVSDEADSIASMGILPVGSVTYRVYVDMLPGYNFKMAFGDSAYKHNLIIKSNLPFFNNEDRGATNPNYTRTHAEGNTVMLDSWLSTGAACSGYFGILKSEDDSVETIVNADGILQNDDTTAGIPLTIQDGLIAGTPGTFSTIGIPDSILAVFDVSNQFDDSIFFLYSAGWVCQEGAVGPNEENKVLIAQLTTRGQLHFELNIQIGTPDFSYQVYVAKGPALLYDNGVQEIIDTTLNYTSPKIEVSDPILAFDQKSINKSDISISPNPVTDFCTLNISTTSRNSGDYYVIYDITGKPVLRKNLSIFSEKYTEKIDMSAYNKGIYFVEVSLNGNKSVSKLIKK